jgi:DNA-binding SARP family transcriptional activator
MPKPEPDHLIEAAEMLVQAGREDDALRWLDRAPLLAVTVERAVAIEMRAGRADAALRRMDALIEASSVKEPLLAKRASLLAQAGRMNDSIQAWESLLKHMVSMPPQARESHAMSKLALQTQQALASLRGTIATRSP